ncbi:hypothetical protein ACF3NG_01560 [Aerococcaceae bacterium WGS1372]
MRAFLAAIVAGLIFLATAFMLYNPAPPAGKTSEYIAESSLSSQVDIENSVEETDDSEQNTPSQSIRTIELDESEVEEKEDKVVTGMAILRPSRDRMLSLTRTLPYTEDELVYWNNLALEHGLQPFNGAGDFYTFTQAVQQAIDQASIAQEPVYEEPTYEEPVYENPVYEEPGSEDPVEEVPSSELPGSELPDESFDSSDVYPYTGGSSNDE